jgi:hypothetical protein
MDEDHEYFYDRSSRSNNYINAFTFAYVATMLLLATVVVIFLLTHTR